MSRRIEEYALIGNTRTAALVDRSGSIDWLCLPRFDSSACFASLLGTPENGFWQIAPATETRRVQRRYRGETLVLETEMECDQGRVALIDFMPVRGETEDRIDVVRLVRGCAGRVAMRMQLKIRFDYGHVIPWVSRCEDGLRALAGPDGLILRTPVETVGHNFTTEADFTLAQGDTVPFALSWFPSHRPMPPPPRRDRRTARARGVVAALDAVLHL